MRQETHYRHRLKTLAEHIAQIIIKDFKAPWVKVSVAKLNAIRGSRMVGVSIKGGRFKLLRSYLAVMAMLLLYTGCSTYQPARTENICTIFRGDTDWYESARDANKRWGTPVWVMMAIIDQESRFVSDAQPDRDWFLFIPLPRRSSAYGYAQAQDPAWDQYMKETGNSGHDRDDFADAINFVGWYTHYSQRTLGISKWDAYNQYLAYHEGHGGYKNGTWKSKGWLKQVASKVKRKSDAYNAQLKKCKPELDDEVDSWF